MHRTTKKADSEKLKALLRFPAKAALKHLGKNFPLCVLKGQKMSINEVVHSFITVKKYEKHNPILPFETEKMLDELMAGQARRGDAEPNWVIENNS